MRDLVELLKIVRADKLKADNLWPIIFEAGSKTEKLCEAVSTGTVKSDDEAITLLYPGEKVGTKYHNLKERLKERLINAVLLTDLRNTTASDRQQAYFECNKKWSTAMVLLSKNAKTTAIALLEAILGDAVHFEFTELSLSILSALRLHYGTTHSSSSKYTQYREQYEYYQTVWMAENEAEDLYTYLISNHVNTKSSRAELAAEAAAYHQKIATNLAKYASFRLHLCGRLIETMIYSSNNDYASTARVCEEAIAFFNTKSFESRLPQQAFYYQLTVCYIQMLEFEKGRAIIETHQAVFEEGSFNWFKLQELFFLLAMYTQDYDSAFDVCMAVLKKLKASATQPPQIVEIWKIYEAYIHYLHHIGKMERKFPETAARFRISKFHNEVPNYSKDKQGMNIPVLIVQILFSISDQNFHQSVDRIEAIEKYCSRYLKHNETYRSNCFIKALLQIPGAAFHREAVIRKADKYITQLKKQPLDVSYQAYEIEIIPYEHLWEMALSTMNNQIANTGAARRATAARQPR